jgi:hypothetical protein
MSTENNNFDDIAKNELSKREKESGLFEQEAESRAKTESYEEGEVKPTSLGKSSDWQKKNEDSGEEFKMGWHTISPNNFPSRGLFYPEKMKVSIRAATVKEIRQFSIVNDDDPFSIDEAMNHIMSSCVNVNIPNKISNWKDLCEEDRIHVVLAVKELTFAKGENKLNIPLECPECEAAQQIEFCNANLRPNSIDDKMMKYFDHDEKIFKVQTKSSGVLELKPPTIGVMKVITQYIKERTQTPAQRKKIDQGFIKVLPYIVHDWRGFSVEKIKDIEIDFMRWDATKYSTFFQVVDLMRVGVDEKVHSVCTSCGAEVHVPITFPGGIKSLFVVSDLAGELL